MTCPKCGASETHLVSGKTFSWEPESVKCVICGWRVEMRGKASLRQRQSWYKGAPIPCAAGCGETRAIMRDGDSGLCESCYHEVDNWLKRNGRGEMAIPLNVIQGTLKERVLNFLNQREAA